MLCQCYIFTKNADTKAKEPARQNARNWLSIYVLGEKRLELLRIATLDPKSSASAIPPLARVNVSYSAYHSPLAIINAKKAPLGCSFDFRAAAGKTVI